MSIKLTRFATIFSAGVLAGLYAATPAQAQDAPPRLVKLMPVIAQDTALERQFFGHVAARETVDLAFQVGGQVVEIPIVEGQPVAKGAVIAALDLEPFELALDQARVQQEQADRNLARLQQLRGNTVSQVTVDDAETQVKLAAIAVRNAERSLKDATLLAPFEALVATRNVAKFSTIGAGTPIARLHDMSELRVEIDVPEILFQKAGETPDVELWAKFPASETRYPLETREFNAETSQVGQTFRLTLGMVPPKDLVVLPGSSVTVYATLRGAVSSMTIPGAAVVTGNDGSTQVMVFEPNSAADGEEGVVKPVAIEIAPTPTGAINVISGLTSGQEIVASGAQLLNAGDTVRRFTGFSN